MNRLIGGLYIGCILSNIFTYAQPNGKASPTAPDTLQTTPRDITSTNDTSKTVTDKAHTASNASKGETQNKQPQLNLIDQVVAVVMDNKNTRVLTLSELQRPSLSGEQVSLSDKVFELAADLKAEQLNIKPDQDAMNKYLNSLQKDHNLTPNQLEQIFEQSGYTLEEGRQELAKLQTIRMTIGVHVPSDLIVPKKMIVKYYEEHPVIVDARYQIQYALIPFATEMSKKDQYTMIMNQIKEPTETASLDWNEPFWVAKNRLAEEKYFITDLSIGEISAPLQTEAGFEIYRLNDKTPERVKTLEECYSEIAANLRRPYYTEQLEAFKEKLLTEMSVQSFELSQ